jgi:lambda family phage minor tail protein L
MSINASVSAGSKKIFSESAKFAPSLLISFYELDFTQFGLDRNNTSLAEISFAGSIPSPYGAGTVDTPGILRFHNISIMMENTSVNLNSPDLFGQLIWKGKRYIPFPITIEGYEMASRGTLPKPKMTFANHVQNAYYNTFFTQIKSQIRNIGDIIGLKILRRRTFLKYLDAVNFKSNGGIINDDDFQIDPDNNAELAADIYYIDRKLKENKNVLEYELSSILDLENIKLPLRTLYSTSCSFDYRGEGCEYSETLNPYTTRKNQGKPIANDKDELITDLLGLGSLTSGGEWNKSNSYSKGNYVFININGIKNYFVSKTSSNTKSPYDTNYWIADQCSKKLKGCRKRYAAKLPFGGFPSTNKEL